MARRISPSYHPGEILQTKFLTPMKLSAQALAKKIHVSPSRIERIITGRLPVTVDSALRLAKHFNTSPNYWLTLQQNFDLNQKIILMRSEIDNILSTNQSNYIV